MDRMNIIVKKAMLEVLEELYCRLDDVENDCRRYWGRTDRQEQKTRWNKETHESDPVFDDNGEPVMEYVYDYIEKTEDEITDRDKAKLSAIDSVRKSLDKLV